MKSVYIIIGLRLLLFFPCLISMEKNIDKHVVSLKLDDGLEHYPIARWKVTHQSNTLCESYGKQKQRNVITIPGITRQEIVLYDKALNTAITSNQGVKSFSDFFKDLSYDEKRMLIVAAGQWSEDGKTKKLNAKRLCCQLLQELIDPIVIKENVIHKASFSEYNLNFDYLLASIIQDNIRNKCFKKEQSYSYDSDVKTNPLVKKLPGGYFKFVPKIEKLGADFFNGNRDIKLFYHEKEQYLLQAYMQQAATGKIVGFSGAKNRKELSSLNIANVWYMDTLVLIKEIRHDMFINCAIFSPNGEWIATSSNGGFLGKLLLTSLNGNAEYYLKDFELIPRLSAASMLCFNNASTVLVVGRADSIDLFDVKKQLLIETFPVQNRETLSVCFNKDDSRLICCLRPYGMYNSNQHTIDIWDTSDLNDIKKLATHKVITKDSSKAVVTFNPLEETIISVLMDYNISFFDVYSGKYLSCIEDDVYSDKYLSGSEYNEVLDTNSIVLFIPHSPLACVVLQANHGKDSYSKIYDYISGDLVGTISSDLKYIEGVGFTDDLKYLVSTFCGNVAVKTRLYSNSDAVAYNAIKDNVTLVDLYLLLQLQRAKKKKKSAGLHCSEYGHVGSCIALDDKGKMLIKNYFL